MEKKRDIELTSRSWQRQSPAAGRAAGAGARLWCYRCRLTDPLRERGQGRKRGQTVPGAQGCLGRSEQAGIPSSDMGCIPPGASSSSCANTSRARTARPAPAPAPSLAAPAALALQHLASAELLNGAAKGHSPSPQAPVLREGRAIGGHSRKGEAPGEPHAGTGEQCLSSQGHAAPAPPPARLGSRQRPAPSRREETASWPRTPAHVAATETPGSFHYKYTVRSMSLTSAFSCHDTSAVALKTSVFFGVTRNIRPHHHLPVS